MASINDLLPKRTKKQEKLKKGLPARVSRRKLGRKYDSYNAYRNRVGKPNGPGVPGNKAGKNKTPR